MFLLEYEHWPLVTISFCKSDWKRSQFDDFINNVQQLFEQKVPINLLIKGNPDAENPPLKCWTWILGGVMKLRHYFPESLHKTAIFKPSDNCDSLMSFILAVYIPVRPLQVYKNYDDALMWVCT